MDAVPLRFSVQRMKIKPRQIQMLKAGGAVQRIEASDAAPVQIKRDVASSVFFKKLLQAFVPEADDHCSGCNTR